MSNIIRLGGGGADLSVVTAGAADVLSPKVIVDVNGNPLVGTMPSKAIQTYTPGTANQTIAAGQYLSGIQTILGDADLISGNIKSGANIFGVAGTAKTAANYETGSVTSVETNSSLDIWTVTITFAHEPLMLSCFGTYAGSTSSAFFMVDLVNNKVYGRQTAASRNYDLSAKITYTYNSATKTIVVTVDGVASQGDPTYWHCLEM